jgi:hypothetical protein
MTQAQVDLMDQAQERARAERLKRMPTIEGRSALSQTAQERIAAAQKERWERGARGDAEARRGKENPQMSQISADGSDETMPLSEMSQEARARWERLAAKQAKEFSPTENPQGGEHGPLDPQAEVSAASKAKPSTPGLDGADLLETGPASGSASTALRHTPAPVLAGEAEVLPQRRGGAEGEEGWEKARGYAEAGRRFAKASLVCQVMCGMVLSELHKVYEVRPGKAPTKPLSRERGCWSDVVAERVGISETTAWRWMEMGRAVKSKWKKLPDGDRLKALMDLPVAAWTQGDCNLIDSAVHKVTDGRTQLEFLQELGLAKKPGNPNLGGDTSEFRGGEERGAGGDPEAELETVRMTARADWVTVMTTFGGMHTLWMTLSDPEVSGQISVLEKQLAVRRAWLAMPQGKRNAAQIEEML